jgi:DNA-binding response OmpR family regulator
MPTKVLVFESDAEFAAELRTELGKLDCVVTVVDDGNAGLQAAVTSKPDLILLAIELPRTNGFSVCNKLKKDPNLKEVPLIIMSSESSNETFEQHRKLRTRAEDYVHKPIALGELLQHIQQFVALGESLDEGDAAILIDDDIEMDDDDERPDDGGLSVATSATADATAARAVARSETVDPEVNAFAETAFGRLTGRDPKSPRAELNALSRNGANERMPAVAPTIAFPPVNISLPHPSSELPPTVDLSEHDRLKGEKASPRERADEIERALREARAEAETLRRDLREATRLAGEVVDLKAKLAAATKTPAISSREFLDLREALNRKDKEILTFREQLSRRDKDFVELHDRQLAFERTKADLEERLLLLERELAEVNENAELLVADREQTKTAADDANRWERQLAEVRFQHREELELLDSQFATLRTELDQTLAKERAEHARALDQAEQRRRTELEEMQRSHGAERAAVRAHELREGREAFDKQSAQLAQDYEAKLSDLRREQEEALAEAHTQATESIARARAEFEHRERAAVDAAQAQHAEHVKALEDDRDARLAASEARATHDLSEANDKLAKLDMDLSATRGELAEVRQAKDAKDGLNASAIADLELRLSEVRAARDGIDNRASAALERVDLLESELASVRNELIETKETLSAQSSRADRAQAKWDADRRSLERAKEALAVALLQIEETEGRGVG